jgi:hypothetical protein
MSHRDISAVTKASRRDRPPSRGKETRRWGFGAHFCAVVRIMGSKVGVDAPEHEFQHPEIASTRKPAQGPRSTVTPPIPMLTRGPHSGTAPPGPPAGKSRQDLTVAAGFVWVFGKRYSVAGESRKNASVPSTVSLTD